LSGRLIKIVEDYFAALRDIRRLRAGTPERSYYSALDNLQRCALAFTKRSFCAGVGLIRFMTYAA